MEHLAQILLLLAVAVAVVVTFQRFHVPTSLGYLLVGVILGPHTLGSTVWVPEFETLAEFGVVFLLFTIGLNFSLPQLQALRHQVLGLGTGQVVLKEVKGSEVKGAGRTPLPATYLAG
jgi:CPA2 family monovalent cation:H+ antiporter-2